MKPCKVDFYKDERGREPVREFIDAQDQSMQVKFSKLFNLLQIYGPDLMMPYARYLHNGLYELRLRGKNEVRIFYVHLSKRQVAVLLHAFKKRTQKMPEKELSIARKRLNELTGL